MAQAVTLMMASRGCSIFGIGNVLAAHVAFAVPSQCFHGVTSSWVSLFGLGGSVGRDRFGRGDGRRHTIGPPASASSGPWPDVFQRRKLLARHFGAAPVPDLASALNSSIVFWWSSTIACRNSESKAAPLSCESLSYSCFASGFGAPGGLDPEGSGNFKHFGLRLAMIDRQHGAEIAHAFRISLRLSELADLHLGHIALHGIGQELTCRSRLDQGQPRWPK